MTDHLDRRSYDISKCFGIRSYRAGDMSMIIHVGEAIVCWAITARVNRR